MIISTNTAKKIAQEMALALNRDVFVTDTNGVIVAGSKKEKIGNVHQLALKLISDNQGEIVEENSCAFAIESGADCFGYVCADGETGDIKSQLDMLKRTCAIIAFAVEERGAYSLKKRIEDRFLHTWLFGKNPSITTSMIEYAASMDIDITMPRRFFAFVPVLPLDDPDTDKESRQIRIDEAMREAYNLARIEKGGISVIEGSVVMCSCAERDDEKMFAYVEDIREKVEAKFKVFLCAGIDSGFQGYAHVEDEAQKAQKAAIVSSRSPRKETRFYDSINMEIFSTYIPNEVKEKYIRRVFRNIPTFELRDWVYLLNAYYNHEGSVIRAAEELGIPANTLQYKLRKLNNKTGYDPRSIRFSSLFYNALHFYADIKDQK